MTSKPVSPEIPITPFEPYSSESEWHASISIQLGELMEGGFFDLSDDSWQYDFYSEAQRDMLNAKICDRFYYREIGILPPGRWKLEFLRKMNEIMPKYKALYAAKDRGQDIMADNDVYGKNRDVFSDFPATQISPENQDYASNAHDSEYERVETGNWMDRAEQLAKRYNDVDVMILDELESLFSCLMTVSMNGF